MPRPDVSSRHLGLISIYSGRYAIRGGVGLVFVLVTLFTGLTTAHLVITPVETRKAELTGRGHDVTDRQVVDSLVEGFRPLLPLLIGKSPATSNPGDPSRPEEETAEKEATEQWIQYLFYEKPALLSFVFLLMILFLPLFIICGAFNQLSGDVASRGIRYQLLRTTRGSIFLGRFIGTSVFSVFVMAFLIAVIVLYLGLKLHMYPWGELLTWSLHGFLALAVLSLPYVALCAWISAMIDSAFGSLTVVAVAVGCVPLFAFIGKQTWEPLYSINFLLPWGVQKYLLHHDTLIVLGAAAACLGYTAVFLYLGYRHFTRRDI